MSRSSVRGIILSGDELILIKRIKEKETYYVFPGGGIEEGDQSLEVTLERECREELGIEVGVQRRIYRLTDPDGSTQEFFVCLFNGGQIGSGNGPEFTEPNCGKYVPMKVPIREIPSLRLLPPEIGNKFYDDFLRFGDISKIPYSELTRK